MTSAEKAFDIRGGLAEDKPKTATEHVSAFLRTALKLLVVFAILTANFVGLSLALNCNIAAPLPRKIAAALFGFFFGVIYLTINYYSYRVMTLGKVCRLDKKRMFPF